MAFRRWEHCYPRGLFWFFLCARQDSGNPLSPDSGRTLLHAHPAPFCFPVPSAADPWVRVEPQEGEGDWLQRVLSLFSLPPPSLIHRTVDFSSGASGCCCCQEPGYPHPVPTVAWSFILPHFSDIIPGPPHDEVVNREFGAEWELYNTAQLEPRKHSV